MPRKPRFTIPGVPQHVIQRGHNRDILGQSKNSGCSDNKVPEGLNFNPSGTLFNLSRPDTAH
jgi:hypothetical protein